MNSQNFTKDSKTQQIPQSELSKAGKPELTGDQNYSESPASDKDYSLSVNLSELLAKFQQYQERILNGTYLERELNLFVEPLTIHHDSTTGEDKLLELSYEIARQFLTSQTRKTQESYF